MSIDMPTVTHPLPANFRFARATHVIALCPSFLRVTLKADDLSTYGEASIHFRLAQPNTGRPTQWPAKAENGSPKWPDTPDAAHRPIYTARSVDHASNTLDVDVFIHEGGRTTRWAQDLLAGKTERGVVGILGPAGGGVMKTSQVLIASDETGFPAVARLLENLPPDATGQVILEAEEGGLCGYPLNVPERFRLTWLSRRAGDSLGETALDALPGHVASTLWFAGERSQASRVREAATKAGFTKDAMRISGFWRADET